MVCNMLWRKGKSLSRNDKENGKKKYIGGVKRTYLVFS